MYKIKNINFLFLEDEIKTDVIIIIISYRSCEKYNPEDVILLYEYYLHLNDLLISIKYLNKIAY